MADQSKAIDVIQKLLRLSQSNPNEQEAIAAAEKAAALALKHNLDLARIAQMGQQTADPVVSLNIISGKGSFDQWVWNIANALAALHACKCLLHRQWGGWNIVGYGKKHNLDVVAMMFKYLDDAIRREQNASVKKHAFGEDRKARNDYREAFRLQASNRIAGRLHQKLREMRTSEQAAQEATQGTGTALVVANYFDKENAEIDAYFEKEFGKIKNMKSRERKMTMEGMLGAMEGAEAGNRIGIDTQLERKKGEASITHTKKIGKS